MHSTAAAGVTLAHNHTDHPTRNGSPHLPCRALLRPTSTCAPLARCRRRGLGRYFHGAAAARPDPARVSSVGGSNAEHQNGRNPWPLGLHTVEEAMTAQSLRTAMDRSKRAKSKAAARAVHKSKAGEYTAARMSAGHSMFRDLSGGPSVDPQPLAPLERVHLTPPQPVSDVTRRRKHALCKLIPPPLNQKSVVTPFKPPENDFRDRAGSSITSEQSRQQPEDQLPDIVGPSPDKVSALLQNAATAAHRISSLTKSFHVLMRISYRLNRRYAGKLKFKRKAIRIILGRIIRLQRANTALLAILCHDARFGYNRYIKARLGERAYSNLRPYIILSIRASNLRYTAANMSIDLDALTDAFEDANAPWSSPIRQKLLSKAHGVSKAHLKSCHTVASAINEVLRVLDMLQYLEEEQSLGYAAVWQIMQPFHLFLAKFSSVRSATVRLLPLLDDVLLKPSVAASLREINLKTFGIMEAFRPLNSGLIKFQEHLESRSRHPNLNKYLVAHPRSIHQGLVAGILRYMVSRHAFSVSQFASSGYKPSRWIKRMYRQVRDQGFPIVMKKPLRLRSSEIRSAQVHIRKVQARARKARAANRSSLKAMRGLKGRHRFKKGVVEKANAAGSEALAVLPKLAFTQASNDPAAKGTFTKFAQSPQMRASHSLATFMDPPPGMENPPPRAKIVQCTHHESSLPSHGMSGSSNSASLGDNSGNRDNKGAEGFKSNPERMQDGQEPNDGENGRDPNDESGIEAACEDDLETHTPLSYQIPMESLRTAMQASETSFARYYSHALYRGPEEQRVSLHYCITKEIGERVAKYFLEEKVVGFDIEWKPFSPSWSIKENASLIQLACEDRIALFHIALFKGNTAEQLLPQSLKEVIESPDILKVGVNIKGDFTRLEKYLGVKPRGKYELSRLHNVVEYTLTNPSKVNNKLVSLSNQVHQHLLLPLHKGEVRESDWSLRLTPEQLSYAFTDAYAGFRLFDAMEAKRRMIRPIPPRPPVTDFDLVPKPRDGSRLKRAKKPATPATDQETKVEQDVDEDEEDEYETAAEELAGCDDDEASSASETSLESSESSDDSSDDYVPRRVGRVPMNIDGATDAVESASRRVGRLRLAQPGTSDPRYPQLPIYPSDEEHIGQESEVEVRDEDEISPASLAAGPAENTSSAQTIAETIDESISIEQVPSQADDFSISSDEEQEMEALVAKLELVEESREDTTAVTNDACQQEEQPSPSLSPEGSVTGREEDSTWITSPVALAPNTSEQNKAKASEIEQSFDSALILEGAETAAPTRPARSAQFRGVQVTDDTHRTHEYTLADTWANEYLVSSIPSPSITSGFSRIRATMPHLRAYHLWHYQGLHVDEVARHLRDPPLSENTVCGYILQAVNMEKLDCDQERGKQVLGMLPLSVRMSRFKGLSERLSRGK